MALQSELNNHSTKLTLHREVRNTSIQENLAARSTIDHDPLNAESIDGKFRDGTI